MNASVKPDPEQAQGGRNKVPSRASTSGLTTVRRRAPCRRKVGQTLVRQYLTLLFP
jgi:hypothetical protein